MVKNTLVLLGTLLLFNTSILAANSTDKGVYLKAMMGASKISGIKTIDRDINFKVIQKSKISQTMGGGIGYYINSRARVELAIENCKLNFIPKRGQFYYVDNLSLNTGNQLIKRNANVQNIMLNTYVDLITRGSFKVFGGGGIGSSSIKEKITSEFKMDDLVVNGHTISIPKVLTTNTKKAKTTFAYALTIGSDIDLVKNFHLELAYSWKHYGKIKNCNNKYQGHNMSTSIRFDL